MEIPFLDQKLFRLSINFFASMTLGAPTAFRKFLANGRFSQSGSHILFNDTNSLSSYSLGECCIHLNCLSKYRNTNTYIIATNTYVHNC